MTVLFDINHPAHVHYFKNSILQLTKLGYKVVVVSRNKEFEHALLKANGIEFISRGTGAKSFVGRFFYHIYAVAFIYSLILLKRVKLVVSFMHPYAAQAAFLSRRKSIVFSDTENAVLHHKLTIPFASEIHTGESFKLELGGKHFRYKGFMELAYLHPLNFVPNKETFSLLKTEINQKIILVRFVSRTSVHDYAHTGLSNIEKIELIKGLTALGKVYISSEVALPKSLEKYRLKIAINEFHNLLYYSSLFIGESATIAAESSLLGVPTIYIDNEGRGYIDWLIENYDHIDMFEENRIGVEKSIFKSKDFLESKSIDQNKIRTDIQERFSDQTEYILEQILKNIK